MSVKQRLRTLVCCVTLEVGTLLGVPMRPEQIQDLMQTLNQPQIAQTNPDESDNGDGPEPGTPREPVPSPQKGAILAFVMGGKGFLGVHSASDTLYDWPDYGRLVGAYFKEHPWTQHATVLVEDQSHPATAGLGDRIALREEFYTFRDNLRPRVHVLLGLDPASVGATGDYPLA